MLLELSVRDLGVIADLTLVVGRGMTALTGETGAGKTLLVEAIDLLVGGRTDAVLVRPGAGEAWVEGRFEHEDDEIVLARALPSGGGRSRAYRDGRMVTVAALAEAGVDLVDLHGQHAHQSLLRTPAQRTALDSFSGVDLEPLARARTTVRALDEKLAALGGDARARAREIDLLRFQIGEIAAAAVTDPAEAGALEEEEDRLADAAAHRDAAWSAYEALRGDGMATDAVRAAAAEIAGRNPFASTEPRLQAIAAELDDVAADLRATGEAIEDDPGRLEEVRRRRQSLRDLCRKYGDTLADVLRFADDAKSRLAELESYEATAADLEHRRVEAIAAVESEGARVGAARRGAAPRLASAIEEQLRNLAMPRGRFDVAVGDDDPGDDVTFLLSANPGEPVLPLTRVASGGELSRTMLAARLVLTPGPGTLIFDEVDAGIGGEAALAVGRALAALARERQVLVVTHLPQVAAFADRQIAVTKRERRGRTVAEVAEVEGPDRVVELSRMLSGQPDSRTARGHAEELLAAAAEERAR